MAVDSRGRALWERNDVWVPAHATLFRRADGTVGVAAAVSDTHGRLGDGGVRVQLLEPRSGATMKVADRARSHSRGTPVSGR